VSLKTKWFWITFVVWLVLDQVTKIWVYTNLEYRVDAVALIPGFLEIVHAQNPGAAFGLLNDFECRHLVFVGFTVVAVGVIVDLYRRLPEADRLMAAALGLIMSGAVGNAIDRLHKRTVTDFVRVFTEDAGWVETLSGVPVINALCGRGSCEWPSFNIADSALLVGVVLFFFQQTGEEPAAEAGPDAAEPGAGG